MTEHDNNHGKDPNEILRPHAERLKELQARWNITLPEIAAHFGLSEQQATPPNLQERTIHAWMEEREKAPGSPIVIGIAGPGACGKGTVGNHLESTLGYPKIINTTTRSARSYEVDGEHYHFLTPDEFEAKKASNDFLTVTERPQRGSYAISKSEVEDKVSHGHGCVIEENPITLLTALEAVGGEKGRGKRLTALLYILPPEPMVTTLAQRLYERSSGNPAERMLSGDDVESTLGDRQIDEFASLALTANYPDVNVVFLVNDDLDQTKRKLDILFGMDEAQNRE